MKTLEYIIPLTVQSGTTGNTASVKLPAGKITHAAIFYRDYSSVNSGFVRAAITDVSGTEVSRMQSINNYRDREAGYLDGKKPLNIEGGNIFNFIVQASVAFSANFIAELVFVYENPIQQNC